MKKLLLHTIFCVLLCYFGFSQETKNAQVDIYATEDKDALQIFDPNGDVKFVVTPNGAVYLKGIDLTNIAPVQGMIALNSLTGRLMTYDEGSWKNLIQEVPVKAINGQTGMVSIDYKDVGAEQAFEKNEAFNKVFGTTKGTVKEGSWRPTWDEVLEKPSKFPPSAHTHSDYVSLENGFDVNTGGKLSSISGSISHQSNSENNYGGLLPSSFGSSWLFNSDIGRDFAFYKDATSEDLYVGFDNPTSGQFEFKKLLHEDNLEIAKPTWNDIINKPTTFNPSVHQHDASEISSGIFSYNRLPFSSTSVSDWNKAFYWGNHADAGYLKSTDTDSKYLRKNANDTFSGQFLTLSNTSNHGIVTGSDSQRLLIGGGSNWNGNNGAYISIEGLDYGGVGAGGDIHLLPGAGGILNSPTGLKISSASGAITNSNNNIMLRSNGSATVLSSANDAVYIRPVSDSSTTGQLVLDTSGSVVTSNNLTVNGSANVTSNVNTSIVIADGGGGNAMRIYGTSTGNANVAYTSFYESNGTTRQGYIGFGSSSNSNLIIRNDIFESDIRLDSDGVNGFKFYDGASTRTVYHTGNHRSNTENDARYYTKGQSDSNYILKNSRTDGGYAWIRRSAAAGGAPLYITNQGAGELLRLYQGTGDGSVKAIIENDGTYRTSTGGLNIKGLSKLNIVYNEASNGAVQRSDARPDSDQARLHKYGLNSSGATRNFKEAWYDGDSYVTVTGENNGITFGGSLKATSFIGKSTDSDKLDGLNSNLFMRAHTANGYFGLAAPGNNTTNWIRTTSNGLLPYASNATNGTSSLGTSSWPFANIYGKNIYGRFHGTANNANTLGGQNTAFFRNASNLNAGTVNYNRLPIGTSSTTVAVGNHTHSNYVPTSRTITAGEHISGGGNLGGNRTFNFKPDVNTWVTDSQGKQRMYFYASASNGGGIILKASGTTGQLQYRNSGNSTMFSVDSNGTVRASGDVIAGSSSDKRLKDSIVPISNPLGKIQKLSGNSYKWNGKQTAYKPGTIDYGVIAQEVIKVLPNSVKKRATGFYEVDYKDLIPLLIEGIKAQQKEIEKLKVVRDDYEKGKEKMLALERELEIIKKKLGL